MPIAARWWTRPWRSSVGLFDALVNDAGTTKFVDHAGPGGTSTGTSFLGVCRVDAVGAFGR
ncbi:MAG: hypothetical protein U5R48_11890 [Gammaproteobacteria bacterium]|nr:hypothetical protein [Gammaproteobacteria bacterium]